MMTSTRRHIFLTGFMGTGKSATGALVAKSMKRPFYDLDAVVEETARQPINTIFANEGEAAFRNHESNAFRSIVSGSPSVIALGGGAPTVRAISLLAAYTGRSVWLTTDWTTVWERIRTDTTRPLLADVLNGDDADEYTVEHFVKRAKELMVSREPAYQEIADWSLDTTDLTPEQAAQRIIDMTETSRK